MSNGSNNSPPEMQLPNGKVVNAIEMQRIATFSPELEAALRQARDLSGNRYMICVFTANENGETISLHTTRGNGWKNDFYLRSFQLFVADHHKITPDILSNVQHK